MRAPILQRNQDIYLAPDQLFARVPEMLLRLLVDQNDFALAVGHNDGAGSRLDNQPEHVLGAFVLSHIASDMRGPLDFAAGASDGRERDIYGDPLTGLADANRFERVDVFPALDSLD